MEMKTGPEFVTVNEIRLPVTEVAEVTEMEWAPAVSVIKPGPRPRTFLLITPLEFPDDCETLEDVAAKLNGAAISEGG